MLCENELSKASYIVSEIRIFRMQMRFGEPEGFSIRQQNIKISF